MNELLKIGGMNKYISASQPLCQLFSKQPALPHLCKSWGDGICYTFMEQNCGLKDNCEYKTSKGIFSFNLCNAIMQKKKRHSFKFKYRKRKHRRKNKSVFEWRRSTQRVTTFKAWAHTPLFNIHGALSLHLTCIASSH